MPIQEHGSVSWSSLGAGVTVRARLLGAVLVPLVLVATVAIVTVASGERTVRAVATLSDRMDVLTDLAALRANVFEERRQYETVARSAAVGLDPAAVSDILGIEVEADPTAVRSATDASMRRLRPADRPFSLGDLGRLRSDVDRRSLSLSSASERYSAIETRAVASLAVALDEASASAVTIGDVRLERAVRAMNDAVQVASQRGRQIQAVSAVWFTTGPPATSALTELARSTEVYQRTAARLADSPEATVATAWAQRSITGDRFDEQIAADLAGAPVGDGGTERDLRTMGRVLGDGLSHYKALASLPEVAAGSVVDLAFGRGAVARADGQRAVAAAMASIAVALAAALWFGRSISRPLRTLTDQVRRVSDGEIAQSPLPLRGPAELQVASAAFNDVAANIELIERKALALAACDFSNPALGTTVPGRLGEALSASLEVLSDSVMQRHQLQARLLHQATHDSLTGLANRRAVIEVLGAAVGRSCRSNRPFAVVFIDLDDFKATNDSSGHAIGDLLLQDVARRMRDASREDDVVARLGGDEFVIVAEQISGPEEALALVRRVLDAIAVPIRVDGRDFSINASAGIAIHQGPTDDPLSLLAKADLAVYRSKRRAPSAIELYDDELHQVARNHAEIEAALWATLGAWGDELDVHYQPVVDAQTGTLVSLEALVRWNRPGEGPIAPDQFIPIAEGSDLIVRLDRWVMREATRQLAEWTDHPILGTVTLAVNISARHMNGPMLVVDLVECLESSGIAPERLILEVTETALVKDLARTAQQIDAVRALGVAVAADDFGTGHTGLTHLRTLTVDEIKIDRSFTSEFPAVTELVQIVMDLARHLGVRTVAEGVETMQQAEALRAIGCDMLQGFLFSPALPPTDLECWLRERGQAPAVVGAGVGARETWLVPGVVS